MFGVLAMLCQECQAAGLEGFDLTIFGGMHHGPRRSFAKNGWMQKLAASLAVLAQALLVPALLRGWHSGAVCVFSLGVSSG